jgi:hypothetical protein
MVMDFEPVSMRIHNINDALMKELNDEIKENNINEIIKIIDKIYEQNNKIYDEDENKYIMYFSGIAYQYPDGPRFPWKQDEIQYGKYHDQYTKETELISINLKKLNVPCLQIFEDKIQMLLMLNNNDTINLILIELPITDFFGAYHEPTIVDCDNKDCNDKCKCECHGLSGYTWCKSCFKESYKSQFMHKIIFGAINSDFKVNKKYMLDIIKNSKKCNFRIYNNVHKLKKKTAEYYYKYFEHTLYKKMKSLEIEYELAKKFVSSYEGIDNKPNDVLLNQPMTAYEYFEKVKR